MCADGLASRQDSEWKANCSQADVDVHVQKTDDDAFPPGGFLGEQQLFLQPAKEFAFIENVASVVPKHR